MRPGLFYLFAFFELGDARFDAVQASFVGLLADHFFTFLFAL